MKIFNKKQLLAFAMLREYRAITQSYAVLLVLAGGIFAYGLLYNYLYAPNVVTNAPIAVVDQSQSTLSRNYLRWLNATPDVSIYGEANDLIEARDWMKRGWVQGIIYLPYDFEERVFRGDETLFSLYATTDAFLYFEAFQRATAEVMLAIDEEYRQVGTHFLPATGLLAISMAKPIRVVGTALYNVTEGYGSYLIPGVMIVIIFQTLFMVIGMLTGEEAHTGAIRAYRKQGSNAWGAALRMVCGKTVVYLALYTLFSLFLLGLLPLFFSIPHIGNGFHVFLLMVPFLLSTSFFALAASYFFTDSEAPILMIAFFSVGLIFLSGISYPLELMPWYWQAVHYIIPATPATLAFVKINSMGATMNDIQPEYLTLCIQTVLYFALAVWVYRLKLNKQ